VRSFFGRIYGTPICLRFYLTFTEPTVNPSDNKTSKSYFCAVQQCECIALSLDADVGIFGSFVIYKKKYEVIFESQEVVS
jgi:hypothetical protein